MSTVVQKFEERRIPVTKPQNLTIYLIKLLLRLKLVRFLWVIVVLFAIFSNYIIFPIIDIWVGNLGETLIKIDATEFFWSSLIMLQAFKYSMNFVQLMGLIKESQGSYNVAGKFIRICNSTELCQKSMFYSLYGHYNTSLYTTYVDYGEANAIPAVTCQLAYGADLHCPFFGHIAATTKSQFLYHGGNRFKEVHFFSMTAHSYRTVSSKSKGSSMCARHNSFRIVFSRTIMVQTILVILSTMFYFVISTINCIVELKRNGFLKILFHKGLPIRSYWIAVWSVTCTEVLSLTILLSLSLFLQCPGFYKVSSMLCVFATIFFQLIGIAALALFLTVLEKTLIHISLTMTLIALCSSSLVLIMRLMLHNNIVLKTLLLFILPLSHTCELIQDILLSVILPDSLVAYHYIAMLFVVLFPIVIVALTLYLDFILASGNGMCLQSKYVLDRRFWQLDQKDLQGLPDEEDPGACEALPDTPNFEPMTDGLRPIIRISHVDKVYSERCCGRLVKNDIVALKNVTAHIYEGQITAVIGHNGSGKTTLLKILNGTDEPTSGLVSVNGMFMNNWTNRLRLRRVIGICPQENSLCNALTVAQTIELAQLSCNHNPETWAEEAGRLLTELRLLKKTDTYVSELSIGLLRKLCTAVALIGNAKVLFLDEPTSGVDPLSRKLIWKLLQVYKTRCSIIMSTHAMDEADTLADRKIFLSGGAVICAGSSLFLKSAFDCGFDFNVTLKQPSYVPLLIKQIQQEFANVKVKNQLSTSLGLHLPATEINSLHKLAQSLERRSNLITAFGLLQASLYDIFMRLQDLQPSEVEKLFKEVRIGLLATEDEELVGLEDPERRKSRSRLSNLFFDDERQISPSFMTRFCAIAHINVLRVIRSRIRLSTRIISPAALLLLLFVLAFVEHGANNSRILLRNNITNFGDAFRRGVCLYREGEKSQWNDTSWCFFVFRSFRLSVKESDFLALPIPVDANVVEYLQEPMQLHRIKAVCYSPEDPNAECPIVYTTTWDGAIMNSARKVYIGSFSTFEHFNSSRAASVAIGAYTKFSRFMLAQNLGTKNQLPENAYKVIAESSYNFQSTFIPLYGVLIQLIIIAIVPATFLDDLMEDRETKVKNQLSCMGLGDFQYWITIFLVHWLQYALIYLFSVLLIIAVNYSGYGNAFYLAGIVLPTLTFGLCNNQLLVYILSSLLNKLNSIVTVIYLFFSIFLVIIMLAAQLDNIVGIVLISLIPPFACIALTFHGTKAIFYTLSYFELDKISEVEGGPTHVYFSQPHIVSSLIALVTHTVILIIVMALLHERITLALVIQMLTGASSRKSIVEQDGIGVMEEIQRLESEPRNSDNMLEVRHLSVAYQNDDKVVCDISLAASPGEIFGLLGPNGAGKSTTLAVIAGDLRATEGHCEVKCCNKWMASRLAARKGYIGYCPQYNPQYNDISVREHLEFYARIIGVAESKIPELIDMLLNNLNLAEHEQKTCRQLSFGFRRRLSLAATLLGDPGLLVIDEASTGVDPEGKRILWSSIRTLANRHHCIVVATHNMEEAEALCNRVTVMNQGMLVGLGSVQELKSRNGHSYTLEILVETERTDSASAVNTKRAVVVDAVSKKFPNTSVVEEFANRLIFSIPMSSIGRLSIALMWLAETKSSIGIMYFSFYQMSLDQVFSRMILLHNGEVFAADNESPHMSSEDDN